MTRARIPSRTAFETIAAKLSKPRRRVLSILNDQEFLLLPVGLASSASSMAGYYSTVGQLVIVQVRGENRARYCLTAFGVAVKNVLSSQL